MSKNHKSAPSPASLRKALAEYPTGVTIVSTQDAHGRLLGITANSFASLSLDPPLISWALNLKSSKLASFTKATTFTVNLLAAHQKNLAERFAKPSDDRFIGVSVQTGPHGQPLIDNCLANLECRLNSYLDCGDHRLFIGEVLSVSESNAKALSFHRGKLLAYNGTPVTTEETTSKQQTFADDYLAYLLARTSTEVSNEFHEVVKRSGVSVSEWRVLATLSTTPPTQASLKTTQIKSSIGMTVGELAQRVLIKQPTLTKLLDRMQDDQLIKRLTSQGDRRQTLICLTTIGKRRAAKLIAQAKQHETQLSNDLGVQHLATLKTDLRAIVRRYTQSA